MVDEDRSRSRRSRSAAGPSRSAALGDRTQVLPDALVRTRAAVQPQPDGGVTLSVKFPDASPCPSTKTK